MPETTVRYPDRLRRAASAMQTAGVDALVLCPGADLLYFTGFEHGHAGERLLALVLRADGSSRWVVPAMNVPQVEARAQQGQSIRAWTDAEWYPPALREVLAGARAAAVGRPGPRGRLPGRGPLPPPPPAPRPP